MTASTATRNVDDGTIVVTTSTGHSASYLDLTGQWLWDRDHGIEVATLDELEALCSAPGEFAQGWVAFSPVAGIIQLVTVHHGGQWIREGLAYRTEDDGPTVTVPNPCDPTDAPIYDGPLGDAGSCLVDGDYPATLTYCDEDTAGVLHVSRRQAAWTPLHTTGA